MVGRETSIGSEHSEVDLKVLVTDWLWVRETKEPYSSVLRTRVRWQEGKDGDVESGSNSEPV